VGAGSQGNLFGIGDALASEFRRIEEARLHWLKQLEPTYRIAEDLRTISEAANSALLGEQSAVSQMAKHWQNQQEDIRRMLAPIADLRKQLALDTDLRRLMEDVSNATRISDDLDRIRREASAFNGVFTAIQDGMQTSLRHPQEALALTSTSRQISELMQSFNDVYKHWEVPRYLVESVGAVKALENSIGKLTLPVIDWPSAAALAKLLGEEGIQAQLRALGIRPDGTLLEDGEVTPEHEEGIGLSRKALELMALLSFIAAFLIPFLQELSSYKWQEKTGAELAVHRQLLEKHQRQLEALSKLVERAIEKEAQRADQRFVVLERVALVRADPVPGSSIIAKLLPHEVVRPVAEKGKWIQIEYYDWLRQEYHSGWALKKYFKRVPATYRE